MSCAKRPEALRCSRQLSECRRQANWQAALGLFRSFRARGGEVNVILYTTLVTCIEKSSRWDWTLALLVEVMQTGMQSDVMFYNTVLSACAKASQWQHAVCLLRSMASESLPATVVSYNAVLVRCPWRMAVLQEEAERFGDLTVVTYNSLMSLFSDEGLQLDVISFNAAINACSQPSLWQSTVSLLVRLQKKQIQADSITLGAAADVLPWAWAVQYLDAGDAGVNVVAANAAMGSCDHWEMANEFLTLASRGLELTARSYNVLHFVSATSTAWAYQLAIMEVQRLAAVDVELSAMNSILATASWPRSLQLLNNMAADVITYSSCATTLEELGEWPRSLSLLEKMFAVAVQGDVAMFNAVAHVCQKAAWHCGSSLLQQLQLRSLRQDDVSRLVALELSRWAAALAPRYTWRQLGGDGWGGPDALNVMLASLQAARMWRMSLELLAEPAGDASDASDASDAISLNSALQALGAQHWRRSAALLAATELPLRQSRNALVAQGELRGVAVPVLKKAHGAESADGKKKT
ncbi:unnamed protein product [Cladocopium goreaui]|uniref:Pentacotripeptide-repeat region of PRORP domain-containing protein n=2 Tax=Cladocopium goreaui TaxID=2562237 RepID=A0A9P1BZ90_9DINO|nr:unnamed protein product [Cladocopium goreaui]